MAKRMPAWMRRIKLFLFDVDGVLLVGKDRPRYVSGRRLIEYLKSKGKKVLVLTNTSTHTRQEVLRMLRRKNFKLALNEVLTSSQLLADHLYDKHGPTKCFVIGERGLKAELRSRGHSILEADADAVIVGLDRRLNYKKLDKALALLRKGARLYVTYMAPVYMDEAGPALSAGPIAKALEYASGVKAIAVGKPSPLMFRMALKMAGVRPKEAIMIGDQLDTDIIGAKRVGIRTALVLTGVEGTKSAKSIDSSKLKPDMVLNKADDLLAYMKN